MDQPTQSAPVQHRQMRFLPRTGLTTLEEPTRLTFHLEREHGGLEWAIAAAGASYTFWMAYHFHSLFWLIGGLLGTASISIGLTTDRHTELIVTSNQLLLRTNIGRRSASEKSIQTADIKRLEYQSGGEDAPSGLYAKHGWHTTCLLPTLTEPQTDQVLNQIFRHFPEIGTGDRNRSSLLFGPAADLTKLNLK